MRGLEGFMICGRLERGIKKGDWLLIMGGCGEVLMLGAGVEKYKLRVIGKNYLLWGVVGKYWL